MTGRHRGARAPFRLAALVLPAPRPDATGARLAELEARLDGAEEALGQYGRAWTIVFPPPGPPEPPRPRLRVIRGGAA